MTWTVKEEQTQRASRCYCQLPHESVVLDGTMEHLHGDMAGVVGGEEGGREEALVVFFFFKDPPDTVPV